MKRKAVPRRSDKKKEMKKVGFKYLTTTKLLERFAGRNIELLDDADARMEFQTEVSKVSSGRFTTVRETYHGPKGDHIIDMFRVLEYMIFVAVGVALLKRAKAKILQRRKLIPLGRI